MPPGGLLHVSYLESAAVLLDDGLLLCNPLDRLLSLLRTALESMLCI